MQDIIPLLVLGLGLAGVSALIVARVSARRLVPAMLLWLLAPAIAMAGVLLIGSLLSPAQGSTISNGIFGVMLIGIFVVVPWAAVCLVGFAFGFSLRRKWPPPVAPEPVADAQPEPPMPPQELEAPAPVNPPQRHLPADAPPAHFSQASPDGSLRVDIQPVEWAASQWVQTPRVVETASGRILCDLLGSDWEAHVSFPRAHYVWLGLRRYRSPGYLFAEFDLDRGRYGIALESLDTPDEEGPLGDISQRLELWWQRATASAQEQVATKPPPPRPLPPRFAAWRTALVILVGSLVAIAGLTWMSVTYGIDPPHVPIIIRPGAAVPH